MDTCISKFVVEIDIKLKLITQLNNALPNSYYKLIVPY